MWMNVSTLPASMMEHVIIMKDHISVIARTDGKDKTVKKVRMQKKISNLFSKELYTVMMCTINRLYWFI